MFYFLKLYVYISVIMKCFVNILKFGLFEWFFGGLVYGFSIKIMVSIGIDEFFNRMVYVLF